MRDEKGGEVVHSEAIMNNSLCSEAYLLCLYTMKILSGPSDISASLQPPCLGHCPSARAGDGFSFLLFGIARKSKEESADPMCPRAGTFRFTCETALVGRMTGGALGYLMFIIDLIF